MASFVNAADAVAIAVEIERRGQAFYLSVRDKTLGDKDKEFFAFMAEEERRHENIFSTMLKRLGGLTLPAGSDDDEYFAYVRAVIDSNDLFMPNLESAVMESPLGTAMRFEKDSLLFFHSLQALVPDSEKQHLTFCIDEERKHLRLLAARLPAMPSACTLGLAPK